MERMSVEQYRKHLQGKINREQGESFENAVEASCIHYDLQGEAFIEKTPEPMKPIQVIDRGRGIFKAVFKKPAQPDFKGTLKGGQAVVFDAKSTSTDRISQDAVTPDQWEALDKHQAMGAWAFVLVYLGHRFYRVAWRDWKDMKNRCGHKYMNAKDLAPYEVEYRNGVICFMDLTKGSRQAIEEMFPNGDKEAAP